MRFFAYHGTDGQGRPTQGTIQAASADEAKRLLTGGGVLTSSLRELSPANAATAVRPAPQASTRMAQPVVRSVPAPAPQPVAVAAVRHRFAGNKTSFFFFEALGRYLRSGVAPNRALEELGQRAQKPWLGERLLHAASAVGKGASLTDALDACACFPTGSVGTIRAGEASGSVPDACFQAAEGCERAHRLWIKSSFILLVLVVTAGFWPIGKGIVDGSLVTMDKQWQADGNLPAAQTAARSMGAELRRTVPPAIAIYVVAFGLWRLWLSHRARMLRHRTVLLVPILSGRARDESLARASWALTQLSRAGLPPNRALYLAAEACPNLEIARRFREQAGQMREQDRLSTALGQTGLLEPQLVDVIHNGEVAGDVPGAVDSVYRATGAEFQRKDASASTKIYFVIYPLIAILVAVMVGVLYKTLILGEFRIIQ